MDRVSMIKLSNKTQQSFIYYRLNNPYKPNSLVERKFTYQELIGAKLTTIVLLREQEIFSPRKFLQKFSIGSNESLISIVWFYVGNNLEQDRYYDFIERLKAQKYPDLLIKSKDYNRFIKLVDPYFYIKIPRIEVSYDSKNL